MAAEQGTTLSQLVRTLAADHALANDPDLQDLTDVQKAALKHGERVFRAVTRKLIMTEAHKGQVMDDLNNPAGCFAAPKAMVTSRNYTKKEAEAFVDGLFS
jgi:hypothetical protein